MKTVMILMKNENEQEYLKEMVKVEEQNNVQKKKKKKKIMIKKNQLMKMVELKQFLGKEVFEIDKMEKIENQNWKSGVKSKIPIMNIKPWDYR
ncbi:MAG: hypothetical protein EZS28_054859 [Streblomastix strix]|uniref:Uncharacterized protein n=1 Tax=Streblomastix strix TaxID=222440 RepID=A0A5J4QDC4_9EUKA|nr:MAG: hypothetical protein EZS28_054859 [Streblomastix strix]